MPDIKLVIAGMLLFLAVVAIAGCTGTATPSATPATGRSLPASNTTLPGSATPGGTPPGGMPGGTMPGGVPPGDLPNGTMLTAGADSWDNAGSDGGIVTFLADHETLTRDITADNMTTISARLQNGTALTGAINTANTAKSMALSLDSTSKWTVTGTSYLSTLTVDEDRLSNIVGNGHTIYYDASLSANSWLHGKTYPLTNGGYLTPKA